MIQPVPPIEPPGDREPRRPSHPPKKEVPYGFQELLIQTLIIKTAGPTEPGP